jgi:hypothetical protein
MSGEWDKIRCFYTRDRIQWQRAGAFATAEVGFLFQKLHDSDASQ